MIEKGYLSAINVFTTRDLMKCADTEIVHIVSEHPDDFHDIKFLLTETTKFYTERFSELQKFIKREKRLLVFETPSRVSITHEYTVEGAANVKSGFHFLFNTTERLSWLKIEMEGRRISIASKGKIISLLVKKIEKEVNKLAGILHQDVMDIGMRLYNASDGLPCFVEFNHDDQKGQQSVLFCATFFDSITKREPLKGERMWSPLQEKLISYNYSTISQIANAWIYVKAPSNFVLSVRSNTENVSLEKSKSNDAEITSMVLKPQGERLSVDFQISINVPDALKTWYNGMLYLAAVVVLFGVVTFGLSFCVDIPSSIHDTFNNCTFAVIAALIATRGWLMSEEQVMKKMSNWYTRIIMALITLVIALSVSTIFQHHNSDNSKNNTAQINEESRSNVSIQHNRVADSTVQIKIKRNTEFTSKQSIQKKSVKH